MMLSVFDDDYYDDIDAILPVLLRQRALSNRRPAAQQNHGRRQESYPQQVILARLLNNLLNDQVQHEKIEQAEEKNKFKLMLDVQQFAPHEINVKVVDDFVIVEGCHEDKEDEHGWISRKFTRRYQIPKEWDINQITSKLSSDGVLTILAPSKQQQKTAGERVIQVHRTGKPALQERPQEKKEDKTMSK